MPEICYNMIAISYASTVRGIKSQTCSNIVFRIREFCIEKKLWISVAYIPGKSNKVEDKKPGILQFVTK